MASQPVMVTPKIYAGLAWLLAQSYGIDKINIGYAAAVVRMAGYNAAADWMTMELHEDDYLRGLKDGFTYRGIE